MAGTTILSGSLITTQPFGHSDNRSNPSSITSILEMVASHLSDGNETAAKRRSVLLIYCLYSLLMDGERYQDKFFMPLHDPEVLTHGFTGIGDIAISDDNGDLFECIQIIPNASLSPTGVEKACAGILSYTPQRICLLTIAEPYNVDMNAIRRTTDDIYQSYGCKVLVAGLLPTISDGLRLINEPANFLDTYEKAVQEALNVDRFTPKLTREN